MIVKIIAEFEQMLQKKHALLNRVEGAISESERQHLRRISSIYHLTATLLPIRSVGVQVSIKLISVITISPALSTK